MRSPPIKHKCLNCGHEEWFILYECCCYDYCQCESIKCTKCNGITVPKKHWKSEMIKMIKGDLSQLLTLTEDFNYEDTYNNKVVLKILKNLNFFIKQNN